MTKMLFIQSEDYWGYDASSFDDTINFYKFAWTVPLAQYMEMSEEDQKRLYPCALFYVAGVTDNHNFLTLKIIQDSTEAKVSGMEGTKRRTRRYQIGSNAQYSVGSYALQAAPASATNIMEIKEAVEAGSTSEGSFLVSGFLDDAASVAKQVNYEPAEKSAESVGFAAPATEPSGSAYEPADPTVANPSTEGPSESELITMSAEIEYAELGDESYPIVPNTTGQDSSFSGHGVPQWYGAESSGSIRAYADIDYSWDSDPDPHKHEDQLDESDISGMIEELVQEEVDSGNTSGSGYTSTEVGFEGPGKDDYSYEDVDIHYRWGAEGFGAEGEGDISHSRIDEEEDQPVILRYDNATTFYEWKIVGPVTYDEEYEIEEKIEGELGDSPERGQTDFEFTLDEDGREVNVDTDTDYGEGRFYGLAAEAEVSIEIEDEDGGYQCGKCYTGFEDKSQADNCCSACYECGYSAHVGFERAQKCCACDCDETGGGPDGTCQQMFSAETVVGTMSPGAGINEALEPLQGGLENGDEPSLVPADSFQPQGNGHVIGQHTDSYNTTPMHAEEDFEPYFELCMVSNGTIGDIVGDYDEAEEEKAFAEWENHVNEDGPHVLIFYDSADESGMIVAGDDFMEVYDSESLLPTVRSNHKALMASAAAALVIGLVWYRSSRSQ